MSDAKATWMPIARASLERVAGRYHGFITYGELGEHVQAESGIRTRQLLHYWIGDVLGSVSAECHRRGEPLLSALCARNDETIGAGYAWAIAETYGGEPPLDLEQHAADERLKCYLYFGAEIPAEGAVHAFTPGVARARRAAARKRKEDEHPPTCPTCHLVLPKTGRCDYCS